MQMTNNSNLIPSLHKFLLHFYHLLYLMDSKITSPTDVNRHYMLYGIPKSAQMAVCISRIETCSQIEPEARTEDITQ